MTTLLRARTWRWLRVRIEGFLTDDQTRIYQVLNPADKKKQRHGTD